MATTASSGVSGPRWTIEQVVAHVGPRRYEAATEASLPAPWAGLGADEQAIWGQYRSRRAEPYDTAVDHVRVAWRCTCPSRVVPCKHAIGLLVLWANGSVPDGVRPDGVNSWATSTAARAAPPVPHVTGGADAAGDEVAGTSVGGPPGGHTPPSPSGQGRSPRSDANDLDTDTPVPAPPEPVPDFDHDSARDQRVARMRAALVELDRWLEDRVRVGLADPSTARRATWETLATRLIDGRAGALANRVRRLATMVGTDDDWHERVLAELGMLHLLARGGLRVGALGGDLDDAVATAVGWQVRQADVLGGPGETDQWFVAGRSDVREDRIEVRRVWLRGMRCEKWSLVLSFAAYQGSLDGRFVPGSSFIGDVHRYPGHALRAIVGRIDDWVPGHVVVEPMTIADACHEAGRAVAVEPWAERVPLTVRGWPTVQSGRWVLADRTGSLPLVADPPARAVVLGASAGGAVTLTGEWTAKGIVPLTVHLPDRALDVGPRAEASFLGVA